MNFIKLNQVDGLDQVMCLVIVDLVTLMAHGSSTVIES